MNALTHFEGLSPAVQALLAGGFTWSVTALGAALGVGLGLAGALDAGSLDDGGVEPGLRAERVAHEADLVRPVEPAACAVEGYAARDFEPSLHVEGREPRDAVDALQRLEALLCARSGRPRRGTPGRACACSSVERSSARRRRSKA